MQSIRPEDINRPAQIPGETSSSPQDVGQTKLAGIQSMLDMLYTWADDLESNLSNTKKQKAAPTQPSTEQALKQIAQNLQGRQPLPSASIKTGVGISLVALVKNLDALQANGSKIANFSLDQSRGATWDNLKGLLTEMKGQINNFKESVNSFNQIASLDPHLAPFQEEMSRAVGTLIGPGGLGDLVNSSLSAMPEKKGQQEALSSGIDQESRLKSSQNALNKQIGVLNQPGEALDQVRMAVSKSANEVGASVSQPQTAGVSNASLIQNLMEFLLEDALPGYSKRISMWEKMLSMENSLQGGGNNLLNLFQQWRNEGLITHLPSHLDASQISKLKGSALDKMFQQFVPVLSQMRQLAQGNPSFSKVIQKMQLDLQSLGSAIHNVAIGQWTPGAFNKAFEQLSGAVKSFGGFVANQGATTQMQLRAVTYGYQQATAIILNILGEIQQITQAVASNVGGS